MMPQKSEQENKEPSPTAKKGESATVAVRNLTDIREQPASCLAFSIATTARARSFQGQRTFVT